MVTTQQFAAGKVLMRMEERKSRTKRAGPGVADRQALVLAGLDIGLFGQPFESAVWSLSA